VTMTDVQRATIPHALAGRDVMGSAKTGKPQTPNPKPQTPNPQPLPGSGKTLAFLVPLLESLYRARWSAVDGLGALVISPTRELSLQTFDVLR
jgi:ATP-dependent RNA helicase DDX10/DBP4